VCVKERERERDGKRLRDKHKHGYRGRNRDRWKARRGGTDYSCRFMTPASVLSGGSMRQRHCGIDRQEEMCSWRLQLWRGDSSTPRRHISWRHIQVLRVVGRVVSLGNRGAQVGCLARPFGFKVESSMGVGNLPRMRGQFFSL